MSHFRKNSTSYTLTKNGSRNLIFVELRLLQELSSSGSPAMVYVSVQCTVIENVSNQADCSRACCVTPVKTRSARSTRSLDQAKNDNKPPESFISELDERANERVSEGVSDSTAW